MGTFRQSLEVARDSAGPWIALEALVDTGATYSQIPRAVAKRLRIVPSESRRLLTADGRRVTRPLAIVYVRLDGRSYPTLCALAGRGDPVLLGAVTLEMFGLAADPVHRRLIAAPLYLLTGLEPDDSLSS